MQERCCGTTPLLVKMSRQILEPSFYHSSTSTFPKGKKLHKIFNRYTLKLSYSCMKNMNQVIKSHNAQVMKNTYKTNSNKDARVTAEKVWVAPPGRVF